MKLILFFASLLASAAWAAGGGHGSVDPHAIPWKNIGVQAFNFVCLIGLLIYLLKRAVVEHFEQRLKGYRELVEKAENAKAEAEKNHRVIAERISQLQSSADQSMQQARSEAEELKQRMIADAKVLAQKLQEEAQRSAQLEVEKAKAELRKELLERALEASRTSFKKNLGSTEQKQLQNEFVEKIQVVRG